MRDHVPRVLSFNGGLTDTVGFLALQGLFTAHVTGNFVTLAAALALGTSGAITKLLALPVFCSVILALRLTAHRFFQPDWPSLPTALTLEGGLLAASAAIGIRFGPFLNTDSPAPMTTGLLLVAAMAIQNAVHRVHLGSAPPSTIMTGTTTQLMLDLADRWSGRPGAAPTATHQRMRDMGIAVACFAGGAAVAAGPFVKVGKWCFLAPPVVVVVARLLSDQRMGGAAR